MPITADTHNAQDAKIGGKKEHQKLKTYIVLQYLLKYSDEIHPTTIDKTVSYLIESCGVEAERRSIYRDIKEINIVHRMIADDCSYDEAEELLAENPDDDTLKLIRQSGHGRSSVVYAKPDYDLDDIRLLIESVYSAKFISEKESKRLADIVANLVSDKQKREIEHDAFLTDRVKAKTKNIFYAISTINTAMSTVVVSFDDNDKEIRKHKSAEKISFSYQRSSIQSLKGTAAKKNDKITTVSPYKLLINDGSYYLLAFSDKYQDIRTYRVDRMQNVEILEGVPRDGEEEFAKFDLKSYLQKTFSMFGGEDRIVTLRFINPLLDVALEKFGEKTATYSKVDEKHFQVITHVQISDQFFSWLSGFSNKAKILDPPDIAEQYHDFLKRIIEMYET